MVTVYLFTIVKLLSVNFNGEFYFFVKFCVVALKIGLEESQEEFRSSDLRKKASKEPVGVFPECPGIMSK